MASWRRSSKESATAAAAPCYMMIRSTTTGGGAGGKIPKGYFPVVLVDEEEGREERVLVHVRTLKEPCMAALLEMASQQYGYGQKGILRVPCSTELLKHILNLAC